MRTHREDDSLGHLWEGGSSGTANMDQHEERTIVCMQGPDPPLDCVGFNTIRQSRAKHECNIPIYHVAIEQIVRDSRNHDAVDIELKSPPSLNMPRTAESCNAPAPPWLPGSSKSPEKILETSGKLPGNFTRETSPRNPPGSIQSCKEIQHENHH